MEKIPTGQNQYKSESESDIENEPHLSGQEGIDMMKTTTDTIEGINVKEFLESEDGREMIRNKKIVLAGPPRSGKSCMRQGLKEVISSNSENPYPYILTACPDGEGSWFQETMNADSELANKLKSEYKAKFTPEFVNRISDSVEKLSLELSFIDVGGIISPENKQICEHANGAIILAGETAVREGAPANWKEFFSELGIPVLAEVYSDYLGKEDVVNEVDENGVFRGSVHHLERGEKLSDRECIKFLSEHILNLGK
jgi:CRISPR-associated protein Csx3